MHAHFPKLKTPLPPSQNQKKIPLFFSNTLHSPLPMSSLLLLLLLLTPNPIQPSNLDPKQLTALQSMSIPTVPDPCSPLRNSTTTCDHSSPFRRLLSLSLSHCSPSLSLSSTALRSLSLSLLSLSLSFCPSLPPFPFPPHLLSLSLSSSFHHPLSAISLSRLRSLTHLSLTSVPVHCTGLFVFLSHMPNLIFSTASNCNLSGSIPHHLPCLNLTLLDLSNNTLTGAIPSSLSNLIYLQNLSLSNNRLSGPIPNSMSALPLLTHLDLSSNKFNGSVPAFLAELNGLVYLNLEDNEFEGVLPFNETFVKRLRVFRIGGNGNLCYNRSLVSRKVELGIAECDRFGLPVSPPPDRSSGKSDYGDDGEEEEEEEEGGGRKSRAGNGGGGHHGPSALVLGVAIGLACLVFLVIFVVCLSKICG